MKSAKTIFRPENFETVGSDPYTDIHGKKVLDCNGRHCGTAVRLNNNVESEPSIEVEHRTVFGRHQLKNVSLDAVESMTKECIQLAVSWPKKRIISHILYTNEESYGGTFVDEHHPINPYYAL